MSKEPVKQSVYADFLYRKIDEWFASGRAGFSLVELAQFSGLKVTGNFRRRINHCVLKGTLEMTTAIVGTKQRMNVYYKPIEQQMGDLPF